MPVPEGGNGHHRRPPTGTLLRGRLRAGRSTDLAAPDALFDLPDFSLPLVGTIYAFNLLPILLCVGMVLQQKFSPSAGQGTEQGRQTQKMMMIFMPIFMLFIFYQAPSGLTL